MSASKGSVVRLWGFGLYIEGLRVNSRHRWILKVACDAWHSRAVGCGLLSKDDPRDLPSPKPPPKNSGFRV